MSDTDTAIVPASKTDLAALDSASAEPGKKGINRNLITRSQADLEAAIAHYPASVKEDAIWLQCFVREHCKGNVPLLISIADKLGHHRSLSYWNNILKGHYFQLKHGRLDGNPDAFREIVAALRKHDEQSVLANKLGFIETPTYRCLRNFIHERRALTAACKVGGITGPTGSQKTACLKYYRLMFNHGRTFYIDAPARKSLSAFQRKLGALFDAKVCNQAEAREAEIRKNITEERCIIVDNAQRLFHPGKGNHQPIFDYLMELQEDTNSTWILSFTEDFANGELRDGRAKNYFEQFIGRMGGEGDILRMPTYTPASDLKTIARTYGLNPDSETVREYLRSWSMLPGRIRIVFQRLQRAKQFAQLEGKKTITLDLLKEADKYTPPAEAMDDEEAA